MQTKKTTWTAALMTLFGQNAITIFGTALSASTGLLIVAFLVIVMLGLGTSPYVGIMAFMVLPGVFVGGLLIIPVGAFWERRKKAARAARGEAEETVPPFPVLDFNNPHARRVTGIVIVLTAVNLLIIGAVTFEGVHYMDSVPFCGTTCHTVMEPEYVSYNNSPHLRVRCVECHIGPGAPWFVKAKISGLGQVLAVALNNYEKPVPTPVQNLRPSRDTCEQCHWPEKFVGDRVKIIRRFKDDEANTPATTVLLLHLGGGKEGKGIHSWHISQDKKTIYRSSDLERQHMAEVRVEQKDGTVHSFRAGDAPAPEKLQPERTMDCIDCHNRPTHIFRLPADAVDRAMAAGRIDTTLPFIKKTAVEALTEAKGKDEGDLDAMASYVKKFYQDNYAQVAQDKAKEIDAAVKELQDIYSKNVFPKMNVTWGTHPNNLGHVQSPGCLRCHDESMKTADGTPINSDCTICHAVLAWEEENPEILKQLGL